MTQLLTGHLRLLAPAFIDAAPHDILALDLGNNVFEGEFPQCFAPRTLKFLQLSNIVLKSGLLTYIGASTENWYC